MNKFFNPFTFLAGSFLVMILGVLCMGVYDSRTSPICLEHSNVKEILSVSHRSATFLLEDGQTKVFYQAVLKPGDSVCSRWSDRRPFFEK